MLLRTLLLLLAVIGGYAVETPVLGSGNPPASGSIFPGGVIPSNTQVVYSNGTTLTGSANFVLTATGGDASATLGSGLFGLASAGTSGDFYIGATGHMTSTDYGIRLKAAGAAVINSATGQAVALRINNVDVVNVQAVTQTFTQAAATSGSASGLVYTAGAHTTLTTGTETLDVNYNLARTVQWATTTPTTQRAFLITGPTYACNAAAQTITTAGTLVINGQPLPGTNVTITNAYALWVQAGKVAISDTTASTTTGTGALIVAGGLGVAGTVTATTLSASGGNVLQAGAFSIASNGTKTTLLTSGYVGFWRSGGTIGTAGDCVFSADAGVTNGAFVFRAGPTTPITVATLSGAAVAGTTPGFTTVGVSTITGGVTDGYNGSHRLSPTYDAASALTVTRHNYFDINQVLLTGVGPAAVTDAPLFRFDAAIGTHKTVNSGTTKTSPGTVTAWIVININGVLHYIPCYASKTS